jgi:hypothetical protein
VGGELMPFNNKLRIEEAGPKTWALISPLVYEGKTDTFIVPAGYVTDFASVPRFLHWLVSPYGPYTNAAIVHDWLITDCIPAELVTSYDTDGIFRRIMQELGVSFPLRWTMWAAVRAGALFNSRRSYGRNFHLDAVKVLGILLLALPFLLPGAVGVLISLGCTRVLQLGSGK